MANKQKLSTTINKSIITKLRDQNKLNDSLLVLVSNLTLEDLIAIKLELSCDLINNRLYGFDIWRNSNKIVQEAILKFAISTTKSKKDAARFLNLTYLEFKKLLRKYEVEDYFKDVWNFKADRFNLTKTFVRMPHRGRKIIWRLAGGEQEIHTRSVFL
mgnify:FL=1